MSTSNGEGQALDATVSTASPDGEARRALLSLAETMAPGPARDQIQALADALTEPAEVFAKLADEAEDAAETIKAKMAGMEDTRKAKLAEAKQYRAMARGGK